VSGRPRWGLRARLVVAFVAVALLGTVVTTIYSSVSLTSHLEASARTRLHNSAMHFGDVAAVVAQDGTWTRQGIETLHHLAQIDFLAADLYDEAGRLVFSHPPSAPVQEGAAATAPVRVGDQKIGTVVVSRDDGRLFTGEEIQLRRQLLNMHLVAGVLSAAIAVLVALYLAVTLSRPLRRIRAGADAMSAGDLDARVPETGDDEIAAVADALNRLAETLQQEESLRKESVADLAHELRTPVQGILARVEAAQDGVLNDEQANLSAMHDEALRLARLLDDLSALAEAERPGLLLDTGPVDLAAIAAAQTSAFAAAFADRDIALSSDLEPAVVHGEPKRLEQIVVNLLSNALRYTDAGGSVRVVVRRDGDDALLEVRDTGIGIATEDLPRVFTRFWRGEKSRSRDTGGAGIGLSIVKELVQAHGGAITVESASGEGSIFRVAIPLSERA
jgi:two-component system, OmpR family, sensor histidine kinase BaeS